MKLTMNKKLLIFPVLLWGMMAMAQQRPPGHERIRTLKIAFLTERLDLSPKEAQVFWPIYNAHEKKMEEFRHFERRELGGRFNHLADLSDAEATTLLVRYLELMKEKQVVEETFIASLKGVISPKKTILLIKAEEDFKKRLLQQIRRNRGR